MIKTPVLGIDFGRSRIGVAISDELRMLAHPLETIPAGKKAAKRIAEIVRDRKIDSVVVGLPRNMDGTFGPAAEEVQKFVEELRALVPCNVTTWDERLTTVAAQRTLRQGGKKTRDTRGYVDQVAAQMILQGYLDRQEEAARVANMQQ
jgi:putative Holliday junction resolvase